MSAILELQQTSCTSLRLSIDGTDRRTEGGHSTVTWTLNAYYASIKFSINNHVVKLRNIVCNLPICLQQSCPWVHFLWPNPTQPMDNSGLQCLAQLWKSASVTDGLSLLSSFALYHRRHTRRYHAATVRPSRLYCSGCSHSSRRHRTALPLHVSATWHRV